MDRTGWPLDQTKRHPDRAGGGDVVAVRIVGPRSEDRIDFQIAYRAMNLLDDPLPARRRERGKRAILNA
ncbi:MAG TPA: hypothetical protein VGF98_02040 [Candidatus Tumulicola sp.]